MRCEQINTSPIANALAKYLGVDIGDFLDSAALSRTAMPSGDDTSISALAKFLDELILGIDYECRIEGGKAVSLHTRGMGGV